MHSDWKGWCAMFVDYRLCWNHSTNGIYWNRGKYSTMATIQLPSIARVNFAMATIVAVSFSRRFSAVNNSRILWDLRCLRCQRSRPRNSRILSIRHSVPLPNIDRPLRGLCPHRPISDFVLWIRAYRKYYRWTKRFVDLLSIHLNCHWNGRAFDHDNWRINFFWLKLY